MVVVVLVAEGGKLYLMTPNGRKRIGQVILQHNEESGEPFRIYDAPLDRDKLINMLLIGKEDFERIIKSGKIWPLLNIPLYSTSYYSGIPFEGVKKTPIDFDFIQIQGRALIYADGNSVKTVGKIDGLSAYLLIKSGIVLDPETVILAIDYALRNNLNLPDVKHPLVRVYTLLKDTHNDVIFENIRREGDHYVIRTNVGYIYFDGKLLANTKSAFGMVKKLPIEEGYLEATPGGFVLHTFILRDDAVVDFDVNDEGNITLYLADVGEKIILDAKVSLKDGIVIGSEKQRVKFKKPYKYLYVNNFFVKDGELKAESFIELDGKRTLVVEDAEAFEMTDTLEFEDATEVPFGEVLTHSQLISAFEFYGEDVKYAFISLKDRYYIATYGRGRVPVVGVTDRSKRHFFVNDGLNLRVYRIVRLDKFGGNFKVVGKPNGIEEFVRLLELNLASKLYPLIIKVELDRDVFITVRSPFGEFMFSYSRDEFAELKPYMKLGSIRFGRGEVPLPTDSEGVRTYSVAFEQGGEIKWLVGKPLGVADTYLKRTYVYWNGVFSFSKKKIRPVGIPKEMRVSKEICFSDLFKQTVCVPVSAQRTLF